MQTMKEFLICASSYGLWDIINISIIIGGSVYGYIRFFRPRSNISNFSVSFTFYREVNVPRFPLRLAFNFSNRTGKNVFITSVWFTCKKFRPDPNADFDGNSSKMFINFPRIYDDKGQKHVILNAVEHYLKDGESVSTSVPLDPKHTDDEVKAILQAGDGGFLECFITLLSPDMKPIPYKLRVRPKRDYGISLPSLLHRIFLWYIRLKRT